MFGGGGVSAQEIVSAGKFMKARIKCSFHRAQEVDRGGGRMLFSVDFRTLKTSAAASTDDRRVKCFC